MLTLGLVLLFAGCAFLVNPYQYDESHSSRYYLPVIHALDARMFTDDPVVASISKFRSWFYDAVSVTGQVSHLTPRELPVFLKFLYGVYLLGCFAALAGIARALHRSPILTALIAIMCLRTMGAIVGGEGLFDPTLTHREASVLLGLGVFWSVLSRRYFLGLILLSGAVFVHGLTALHIAWCVVPVMVLAERRFYRQLLPGLIALALAFVFYGVIAGHGLGFDAEAVQMFLAHKGNINHIALGSQSKSQWLLLLGILLLAVSSRLYVAEKGVSALLRIEQFWISGAIISVAVSAAYAASGDYHLALLQPLRCFAWVTLLALIEIVSAAVLLLKRDRLASAVLLATIAFKLAGVLLWVPFLTISIAYIGMRSVRKWADAATGGLLVISVAVLAATLAGFILRKRLPLVESLQSPVIVILCALAIATIVLAARKLPESVQLGVGGLFLALCIVSAARPASPKIDSDWIAMAQWVDKNTQFEDQVLTPPETAEFRNLAYRSPVSEPMSALWWVNPGLEAGLEARDSRVEHLCKDGSCDCQNIESLARSWHAHYFIIEGTCQEFRPPVHQTGSYRLFRISETLAPVASGIKIR